MTAKRDEAGFTLVELGVVMMIFGIVIAVTYSILTSVSAQTSRTVAASDDVGEVRLGLQQIERQVTSGNVLYSPANEDEHLLNGTTGCYGFTFSSVPPTPSEPNAGNCMRVYTQANGVNKCVQWRIKDGNLATRSWAPPWDGHSAVEWHIVARNIVNTDDADTAAKPPAFQLQGTSTSYGSRLVDVVLQVKSPHSTDVTAVQSALAGRNTQYGYDPGTCSPVPAA
jgi:prepilin-type N-terminal cleavage/methylation domain-containing protein